MVGVGAVKVSTRPSAWQDWLAVKNGDGKRELVELTLPRDTLLGSVLDDESLMHPTGLALKVFTLALLGIDLPSRATPTAQSNIVIHAIILADHSGKVSLKP
jgi:hypothetical protein